jgi:hypothetical protein
MLITMHDELVFEINENKLDLYIPRITKIMMLEDILQGMLKWPVPLTVEVKVGDSWRVKEKYFDTHPEAKAAINEPLDFNYGATLPNRYSIALGKETNPDLGAIKADSTPVISDSTSVNSEPIIDSTTITETPKIIIENDVLIYTIKKRSRGTVRWMNDILTFFLNEKNLYEGQRKILRVKDEDGNSLLVSEFMVPVEPFLALAKFFEL